MIACAEREWHAVPAMIVAGALRAEGWQITLLGASTPTARLSRYLQDLGPDVTAVSCSVAAGLPNARGFIEASTTAGIPVLAGGAAFGPDDRRASRPRRHGVGPRRARRDRGRRRRSRSSSRPRLPSPPR